MYRYLLFSFVYLEVVLAFPEEAKWSFNVGDKNCHYFNAHATLFADSKITFKVTCDSTSSQGSQKINIGWVVRASPCFEEYLGSEIMQPEFSKWYYHCPVTQFGDFNYNELTYMKTDEIELTCNHFIDFNIKQKFIREKINSTVSNNCVNNVPSSSCESLPKDSIFFKNLLFTSRNDIKNGYSIQVPEDSSYLFLIYIRSQNSYEHFNATVDVDFKSPTNTYLTAVDRPLLMFYGLMSCLYLIYAIFWFSVTLIQWKEIFRIQFCIAAVILLGMIEKAIFYGVYQSFNLTGHFHRNIFFLAEIFSCFKRTFARVLFIIVSCGYEIVKPHLGTTLNKIIAIGILYFILSFLEATLRIYKPKSDPSNQIMIAGIPLALLDSSICWWILSNLVQTTKILRLRRNMVKLSLFNHFTNVLIFSVIASICFMIWQIHTHKLTNCLTNWTSIWFDEAYWHLLFSIILIAIMILWRPTNNNQRYAFTPLLDVSDEEEADKEFVHLSETGGADLKSRSQKGAILNDANKDEIISKETEDNLKWIEENIKTSVIDSSFTTMVDLDEELINTRFEISKMQ